MLFSVNLVEFEVPDEWWQETGMIGFEPHANAYRAAPMPGQDVALVPIADFDPPRRSPPYPLLFRTQSLAILRGFAIDAEIPPVTAEKLSIGRYSCMLREGFHRFYLSAAAGFTHMPVIFIIGY